MPPSPSSNILLKSSKSAKIVKDNYPKLFLKFDSGVYFLVNKKDSVYGGKRNNVIPYWTTVGFSLAVLAALCKRDCQSNSQ